MVAQPARLTDDAARSTGAERLLGRYLSTLAAERNLSPFTLRNYAADLGHLLAYLDARDTGPEALTRTVFRGYLASMIEAGVAQGSVVRRVSTAR